MANGRPRRHVGLLLRRAPAALWFVPSVMTLGAVVLWAGLRYLDETLSEVQPSAQWWLFGGDAEGARTLLSVIAGSLITVVSVAYSVTMIAIQQAATQYTPRVLRNYTKDRGNQVVLGTYVATFTYALLVLREIRAAADGSDAFVPTWSMLAAMLLALASLGALIYFIHHVSESLQVTQLLGAIREDMEHEIRRLFPETFGRPADDPDGATARLAREGSAGAPEALVVRCDEEGYLQRIDEGALARACQELDLVVVPVRIGDRLLPGDVLLRGWGGAPRPEEAVPHVRRAFQLDRSRSADQDLSFGIRQMVDIAVKALSPSVNDPTTAEEAIQELTGALASLLERDMPNPARRPDGSTRFLFEMPTFESIVDESFSQIRRAARTHVHVTVAILRALGELVARAGSEARIAPLRWQAARVLEALPDAGFVRGDEVRVRETAERVLAAAAGASAALAGARDPAPALH